MEAESKDYQAKIDGAYAEFPKNSSYSLFAVWVHAGVAGSGHYWAYMRCGKRVVVPPKPEVEKEGQEATSTSTTAGGSESAKGKDKVVEGEANQEPEPPGEWLKFNDLKISDVISLSLSFCAILKFVPPPPPPKNQQSIGKRNRSDESSHWWQRNVHSVFPHLYGQQILCEVARNTVAHRCG